MSLAEAPKCDTSIVAGSPGSVFMRVNTAAATPSRTNRVAASRQARKGHEVLPGPAARGPKRAERPALRPDPIGAVLLFSHISEKYAS